MAYGSSGSSEEVERAKILLSSSGATKTDVVLVEEPLTAIA